MCEHRLVSVCDGGRGRERFERVFKKNVNSVYFWMMGILFSTSLNVFIFVLPQ